MASWSRCCGLGATCIMVSRDGACCSGLIGAMTKAYIGIVFSGDTSSNVRWCCAFYAGGCRSAHVLLDGKDGNV